MLREGDAINGIADIVGAKTTMSPSVIGCTTKMWNPNIGMSLNMKILTILKGNLELSTCALHRVL